MLLYNVSLFSNVTELLESIARRRGKLRKGGALDVETAARMLLSDCNTGKIGYYPQQNSSSSCYLLEIIAIQRQQTPRK
jgi:nuclear GTP-binding protein